MAKPVITREGHRVNMYFPAQLYAEMEDWVHENDTNITELCRAAVQYYLRIERLERKRNELVGTCKTLSENNNRDLKKWMKNVKQGEKK